MNKRAFSRATNDGPRMNVRACNCVLLARAHENFLARTAPRSALSAMLRTLASARAVRRAATLWQAPAAEGAWCHPVLPSCLTHLAPVRTHSTKETHPDFLPVRLRRRSCCASQPDASQEAKGEASGVQDYIAKVRSPCPQSLPALTLAQGRGAKRRSGLHEGHA